MKISKKIVMKPVADLVMIEDSHDIRNAIPVLEQSIKDFGIQSPIVIDDKSNIVAGNAVYQAAVNLGIEKVPCVLFQGTPEEMREYRLADNKTAEFASWDTPKLKQELSYLTSELNDMQFAFDEDLHKLIGVTEDKNLTYPTMPNSSSAGIPSSMGRPPIPPNGEYDSQDMPQNPMATATVVTATPQPVVNPEKERQKDDKFREQLRQIEHQQMAKQREYIEYICSNCGRKVVLSNR